MILSFNMIGYRFVANIFEFIATRDMQKALDEKKYQDGELISFKIPLNLPYVNDSKEFVSVEGNIDINGINYQYVKKRVYSDTLEVLCIPNYTKTAIHHQKTDFTKQVNDIANSGQSKKSSNSPLLKIKLSDYTQHNNFDSYSYNTKSKTSHQSIYLDVTSFDFLQTLDQPPEA